MVNNKRIETFIGLLDRDENLRSSCFIGSGSSREAYALGDLVVKVPLGIFGDQWVDRDSAYTAGKRVVMDAGIYQTKKEIQIWETATNLERKMLATLYCHGTFEGLPYVVMERVTLACEVGIYETGDMYSLAKEKGFRIVKNYAKVLRTLIREYGLVDGDLFMNEENFGITKDKKIVLSDYGFCGWYEENYSFEF